MTGLIHKRPAIVVEVLLEDADGSNQPVVRYLISTDHHAPAEHLLDPAPGEVWWPASRFEGGFEPDGDPLLVTAAPAPKGHDVWLAVRAIIALELRRDPGQLRRAIWLLQQLSWDIRRTSTD